MIAKSSSIANRFSGVILSLLLAFFLFVVGVTTVMELFRIERQVHSNLYQQAENALNVLDLQLRSQQLAVSRTAQSQLSINSLIDTGVTKNYFDFALEDLKLYTAIDEAILFDYAGEFLRQPAQTAPWYSSQLVAHVLSVGKGEIIFHDGTFYIIEPILYYGAVQGGIIAKVNLDALAEPVLSAINADYTLKISPQWQLSNTQGDVAGISVIETPHDDSLLRDFDVSITLEAPYLSLLKEISPWLTSFSILTLITLVPILMITRQLGKKMAHPITELASEVKAHQYPIKAPFADDELATLADAFNHATEELNRINEQTIAEERQSGQSKLSAILETVVDGIITIDAAGRIATFNPAAEGLFGYRAAEVIGEKVNILMPQEFARHHDTYVNNYLNGKPARIIGIGREVQGQRKDGSTFPAELTVSEMLVSGKRMFTGIIRDITQRKKDEATKNEFIATVSHELRTPLTSIRGALGLILGKFEEELPDKTQKMLNIALRNCERLTLLINDILDIEKLESEQMVFSYNRNNLDTIVRRSLEDNQGYAKQHDVTLELTETCEDAYINGDSMRLQQVMANLLSNAIKYSSPGASVRVSLSQQKGYFRVEVADTGTGIPTEFHSKIFERFSQADSSDTRRVGGTGLGLAISKSIVEGHRGKIDFYSTPGEGSTFFFMLPIEEFASQRLNQSGKLSLSAFQMLYVGQDESALSAFRHHFYRTCDICSVKTAVKADQALRQQPFDLVVMEWPGHEDMDAFIARLTEQQIPAVALSESIHDYPTSDVFIACHQKNALNFERLKTELRLILKNKFPREAM